MANLLIETTLAGEFKHNAFLSRSTNDKEIVRPLAERLRQDGATLWLLKPGSSIPAEIEKDWSARRVLMLYMSVQAFGSDWARLEPAPSDFATALNKDRHFRPCASTLPQFLYINWRAVLNSQPDWPRRTEKH